MRMQKLSPPEEYWATPPYSSPLNRIRSMMTNLDKELAELYKKKSLEFASKPKDSSSSRKIGPLYPTINIKPSASRATSLNSVKSKGNASKVSLLGSQSPTTFSFERYKRYKNIAMRAYQNRKIFTIYGFYPKIRQSLQKRGWVEKVAPGTYKVLQAMSQHSLLKQARDGNDYELVAISKLLEKYPTYFIWQPKGMRDTFAYALPYRNRIKRSREYDFTTKEGLVTCIDNAHYFSADGVAEVRAPRSHCLAVKDEVTEFLEDYRLTACRSLLQYISQNSNVKQLFDTNSGTVPVTVVEFAINRLRAGIDVLDNRNLDANQEKEKEPEYEEWRSFIINANKVINEVEKFRADSVEFAKVLSDCRGMLIEAKRYWPTMDLDGYKNIWILKPAYCCRGTGIVLMRDYDSMLSFANRRIKMRYVAQKYIERPLLIYKTKFDIRQYILITINENVNIWMYRDCYLKFSSQEFNLADFRECVHITNNTVQRKYKNGTRSDKLPPHNMWNLNQFQAYLKSIGKEDIWNRKIYPGMKQNVIAIVLASMDESELVANNFEMYGCDFMLDEDFNPCLIEINATPDLSPSTCVTAKLCPAAQEDLIKVIVDLPKNPRASTGNFELIYQLPCARVPSYVSGLTMQGLRAKMHPPPKPEEEPTNFTKLLRKTRFLAGKKKPPNVITENDVKEVKEMQGKNELDAQTKPKIQPKNFLKKRKRAGQIKPLKSEKPKVKQVEKPKPSSRAKAEERPKRKINKEASALSIVQKSFEIIKTLQSTTANDDVVGNRVKTIINDLVDPKTNKKRLKKTPGRLSAGGTKQALPSGAKEILALNIKAPKTKEGKILLDFMDLLFRKMGEDG